MNNSIYIALLIGKGRNFARHGVATASSTALKGYPGNAIDGNIDDNFRHGSCTRTKPEWHPWWKVTFEYEIYFSEIIVVNRGDCCGKWSNCLVFP